MEEGIGEQHRGGIFDSWVVAWSTMCLIQAKQLLCPHAKCFNAEASLEIS